MAEIDQNRYDQLIRRVTASVGPGSHVAESLSELFPTIDVENLQPELFLLAGTRLCYGGTTVTGAAGQFPAIQVFNPADSGILVTITRFVGTSSFSSQLNWSFTNFTLATNSTSQRFRDSRLTVLNLPQAEIRRESGVIATGATAQTFLPVDTPFTLEDRDGLAVLEPGSGLEFGLATANTILRATFYWRERAAEQSELNF